MTKKRILLVGMLDSIHFANWVERIIEPEIEVLVFPSRRYRKCHSKLIALEFSNPANLKIFNMIPNRKFSPFLEAFVEAFAIFLGLSDFRLNLFGHQLKRFSPTHIHALEVQSAGYLILNFFKKFGLNTKLIVTNWGSDLYFYSQFPQDRKKIVELLTITDAYSAECKRDYNLARELGFSGEELPLIPNSVSFLRSQLTKQISPSERTKRIVVKAYGGKFGLPIETITAVEKFLLLKSDYQVLFYSVTKDVERFISKLQIKFPNRISFITLAKGIPQDELWNIFLDSRIYLGMSISDGISSSFLEALALGLFPIQTGTSCANEWVNLGAAAKIIDGSAESAFKALIEASDEIMKTDFSKPNLEIAIKFLDKEEISIKARSFYR